MEDKGPLMIPALRAKMGIWMYYIGFMKMRDISERISLVQEIHASKTLQELLQRQLKKRIPDIADYLISQEQRFFNSLVLGTYGGNPQWYELAVKSQSSDDKLLLEELEGTIGFLKLSGTETLFALDGQHRVDGIRRAIKQDSNLETEEVSVLFVSGVIAKSREDDPEGFERTRRLFTTLNRYAKPVNKKDIIALDEDDIVAILTRRLVEEHPLFQGKISITGVNSIQTTDKRSFTTITNLYDVLNIYLDDYVKKLPHQKKIRPSEEEIEELYEKTQMLWHELAISNEPLQQLRDSEPDDKIAGHYRDRNGGHLLFRPIGLKMVVNNVRYLVESGYSLHEATEAIAQAEMNIHRDPWVGLIWNSAQKRMIYASENQKAATRLLFHSVGGDLQRLNTSVESLKTELAGLLNREKSEIHLPTYV
jgi:DNA sulfur modification protein DndB